MLENEEREQEFEVVTASVNVMGKRSAVYESGEEHPGDVSGDERLNGSKRRNPAVFPISEGDRSSDGQKKEFFRVIHARDSELMREKYRKENAEGQKDEERLYEEIEDFRHGF